jgi:hydroxymethylpyrimidine/phosphomethylpyrimidine kinase
MSAYKIVLTIAGSDSGGGAGIQGDLKTMSALGCFATTAITAVTVQNTMGVQQVFPIPVAIVKAQVQAVLEDLKPKAIKIGMVYNSELALALASLLKEYPEIPVVFDPVMVSTSGDKLFKDTSIAVLRKTLLPISHLLTPNLDEASILAEMTIENVAEMKVAAGKILQCGSFAVLVKGGHLKGINLYDVYLDQAGNEFTFRSEVVQTQNTHGTGCSLSSAIASYLALGLPLLDSISKARIYLRNAIIEGKDVKTGHGHGPLNHFFDPEKLLVT